jgi:hypothetical protein
MVLPEHVVALFFKDISRRMAPIKYQIVRHRFMYRVGGGDVCYEPHNVSIHITPCLPSP